MSLENQPAATPISLLEDMYQERKDVFTPTPDLGLIRSRFFNDHKKIKAEQFGPEGKNFSDAIKKEFYEENSIFKPPHTIEKLGKVSEAFERVNKDLTGDLNGSEAEKEQAIKWNTFWDNVKKHSQLDDESIIPLQEDFLASYRYQILSLAKPNEMHMGEWSKFLRPIQPLNSNYKAVKPLADRYEKASKDPESLYSRLFHYHWTSFGGSSNFALYVQGLANEAIIHTYFGDEGVRKIVNDPLIKDGKPTNITPLQAAISSNQQDRVKFLLDHGADPTLALNHEMDTNPSLSQQEVNSKPTKQDAINPSEDKVSRLLQAIRDKDQSEVRSLLKQGVNTDVYTTNYQRSFFQRLKDAFSDLPGKFMEKWKNNPKRSVAEIAKNYGWDLPPVSTPEPTQKISSSTVSTRFDDESKKPTEHPVLWQAGLTKAPLTSSSQVKSKSTTTEKENSESMSEKIVESRTPSSILKK